MSDAWNGCVFDPSLSYAVGGAWFNSDWGCQPTGTIAYHKYLLGWLPANQIMIVPPGTHQTVIVQPLALPRVSTNLIVAFIPIPGTQEFYSIEVRNETYISTYDFGLKNMFSSSQAVVVIHRVDPSRGVDAQVVDIDVTENDIKYYCQNGFGNQNPNDAGGWLVMSNINSKFYDHESGISVEITSYNAGIPPLIDTYTVIIENRLTNRVRNLPLPTTCP
jgi:hypothetical protein